MVNRKIGSRLMLAAAMAGALWTTQASAVTCRSGTAAVQGGQAGYGNDTRKADETEQKDRSSSDILGRCVSGVTGILTIPTFPSLSDIFNAVKEQVCRIASAQVHEAVGSVTGQIDEALRGVNDTARQIPGQGGSVIVPVPVTPPVGINAAPAANSSSSLSDYWQRIWR